MGCFHSKNPIKEEVRRSLELVLNPEPVSNVAAPVNFSDSIFFTPEVQRHIDYVLSHKLSKAHRVYSNNWATY